MKLKRLIVQGFKSFKDRTVIHFDDGITGIVGPNGCGKSNIVDALFWVMGEQSAKHLRGNTMKDVIFAGSSKFAPGAWAEATLVLGNDNGKHIHIGNKVSSPSEIQLTRKLYRNGETEYRINDNPCRLRDIQEVFMDTGAGAKSYSIIAQGEINRLVNAKPEERRTMIEEVAGITKFKMRKRESLKKIEQTQLNLNRLQDLQIEIEKNLKALEKQAEKAERARTLKEKIKRNDLVVNAHKVFDYLKDIRDGKNLINEKVLDLENWSLRKNSLEVSLQEERVNKDDLTEKIEDLQKEYNEVSRSLAASEERLNSLCRSLSDKEKQVEERNKELEVAVGEIENRKARLLELEAELQELNEKNQEEFDLSDLQEQVSMLKDELDEQEETLKMHKEELEQFNLDKTELQQTLFQNTSKLEDYARSLQDITQEIEVLEKQYSGVNTEISDERDKVFSLEATVKNLESQEVQQKQTIQKSSEELRNLENIVRDLSKETVRVESRLSSLKEINASLEGAKEGARKLLEVFGTEKMNLLGGLIKCEEKYTGGVQTLLADLLNVVVPFEQDISQITSWCAENPEAALDLLMGMREESLSSEALERIQLAFDHKLIALKDIVTLDHPEAQRWAGIFEGMFLAEDLNIESLSKISDLKIQSLSTFDGAKAYRVQGGARVLGIGHVDSSSSVIARNNQIEELEKAVVELAENFHLNEKQCEDKRAALMSMQEAYEQLRSELLDKKSEHAAKKSAFESKLSNLETGNQRLEILKKRKAEISATRLNLLESEETNNNKLSDLEEKRDHLEQLVSDLQEAFELKEEQYDTLKEELLEKQVHASSFEGRVKGLSSQIEDVQGQIERQEQRVQTAKNLIEQYEAEIEQINTELSTLELANQEKASDLQDREDVLNLIKDELVQLLQAMQEREDEVKKLNAEINKTEKEVDHTRIKIDQFIHEEEQITRNIFEKYRVDLRLSLGQFLNFEQADFDELNDVSQMYFIETENGTEEVQREPYEFNRRYGQDLKDCDGKLRQYKAEFSKLGDINWQAIEDYDRQKLRFEFLTVQEHELKKSLEDLQLAIDHIDHKSKERFKIAFEEVNTRFEKVFPIIFGGGNAQLKVTGDINDSECGVDIIAQPPGKKMQNINLMSGGEKAMTAVSLIFSIFLVKPSPFCLLDEVDAPLDDANVGRFNELLREMSKESQFILITHNKKTMELNDTLYGVTMQEPGISKAVSVQLH